MSVKYLLPCHCGRQTIIERCQAGETTTCFCGALLEIPTLLEMANLEPAPEDPSLKSVPSTWGLKQAFQLLGILATFVGIAALLVGFFWGQPKSSYHDYDPEKIRLAAEKFTPLQTWDYWEYMKKGLDRRIDEKYAEAVRRYYFRQAFFGVLTLIGIVLIVVSAIARNEERGFKR